IASPHGDDEHVQGAKSGPQIHVPVEARVSVGIRYVDRLPGERGLAREALPYRQADLGRGALGDASPELLLLPVDDVHGAALCIDGLRTEVDKAAQVGLAVLLDGEMAKLDQDEGDLVVKHGDIPPRPPDVRAPRARARVSAWRHRRAG